MGKGVYDALDEFDGPSCGLKGLEGFERDGFISKEDEVNGVVIELKNALRGLKDALG